MKPTMQHPTHIWVINYSSQSITKHRVHVSARANNWFFHVSDDEVYGDVTADVSNGICIDGKDWYVGTSRPNVTFASSLDSAIEYYQQHIKDWNNLVKKSQHMIDVYDSQSIQIIQQFSSLCPISFRNYSTRSTPTILVAGFGPRTHSLQNMLDGFLSRINKVLGVDFLSLQQEVYIEPRHNTFLFHVSADFLSNIATQCQSIAPVNHQIQDIWLEHNHGFQVNFHHKTPDIKSYRFMHHHSVAIQTMDYDVIANAISAQISKAIKQTPILSPIQFVLSPAAHADSQEYHRDNCMVIKYSPNYPAGKSVKLYYAFNTPLDVYCYRRLDDSISIDIQYPVCAASWSRAQYEHFMKPNGNFLDQLIK